ncbi:MAG: phosphoserine phosphatase [Halieaceae bacterium]
MKRILLINVSGVDEPGVTTALTSTMARYQVNVLDIGQAVIHNTLSLGLLVEIPNELIEDELRNAIEKSVTQFSVRTTFTPVLGENYESWVGEQGKSRYIITLLARKVTAEHLARVTAVVREFGLNIDGINRLSGRIPLVDLPTTHTKACVEFSVRGLPTDIVEFRSELLHLASDLDIDLAFQEDNKFRRHRRLVVFDMDSTLIEAEVIDELAKAAGVGEEVSAITERAMAGELDFSESFRERVGLLKGLDSSVLEELANNLPITEGAENLIGTLKSLGYRTAIVSGGFEYFGRHLQQLLGIDYVYANQLDIEDGRVTGRVVGEIVDGKRKAELVRELALAEGVDLEQVIAVGDGANDLPMLGIAGLGIAFRAKPLVKKSASHSISTLGLDGILYLLGISDRYHQ